MVLPRPWQTRFDYIFSCGTRALLGTNGSGKKTDFFTISMYRWYGALQSCCCFKVSFPQTDLTYVSTCARALWNWRSSVFGSHPSPISIFTTSRRCFSPSPPICIHVYVYAYAHTYAYMCTSKAYTSTACPAYTTMKKADLERFVNDNWLPLKPTKPVTERDMAI